MSRGTRLGIGITTTAVLALVALVAILVALASTIDATGYDEEFIYGGLPNERVMAEVLDVDIEYDAGGGWTYLDVRYELPDEVVVTNAEWLGDDEPPRVGDLIQVAYDAGDPEYTTYAVDGHPERGEAGAENAGEDPADVEAAGTDGGLSAETRATLIVAAVAFGLAVVAGVLTAVWVRKAPRPDPRTAWGHPPPVPGCASFPPPHQQAQPYRQPPPYGPADPYQHAGPAPGPPAPPSWGHPS